MKLPIIALRIAALLSMLAIFSPAPAFTVDGWRLGMTKRELHDRGLLRCINHPRQSGLIQCAAKSPQAQVDQVLLSIDGKSGRLVGIDYRLSQLKVKDLNDLYSILHLSRCEVRNTGVGIGWRESCFELPDRMRTITTTPKLNDQERPPPLGPDYWQVEASFNPRTVALQRQLIAKKLADEARLRSFNPSR